MKPPPRQWRRYGRVMRAMAFLSVALGLAAIVYIDIVGPPMPWEGKLAVAIGVTLSMLLAGALMGLVFTSARSGHDGDVRDFSADPD